jgi:hypothetical protein
MKTGELAWGLGDGDPVRARTRHAFTHTCRGCCDSESTHRRTYYPRSLCGQSWSRTSNPVDDVTADSCKSCLNLERLRRHRAEAS